MEILKGINWVDIVALLILGRTIFLGIKTGLSAELFRFIQTLASLIAAIQWYNILAEILIINIPIPVWLVQAFCFVLISLLIRLILKYGVLLLLKVFNMQFLPQIEKAGGALVGLGRGIIMTGLLLLSLSFIPAEYIRGSIYHNSLSGSLIVKTTERAYRLLTFWMSQDKTEKTIFSSTSARDTKPKKK